jgi:GTP cyclohydrolase III
MPTPYTTQKDPLATNKKTGPQTSSTPAGQKPTTAQQNRAAAMAGLGAAKDMGKRKAEIEREDRLTGGESNATAAHAVDLVASTAGEVNLAGKVRGRKGRV